ncbi:MAG: tetratricopeptide repeat-containing sensor histidine kinase [Cyclobacteriaceae bacterium]|nr:tetratricopeptide repeat-containing sensor histidine kinase [Cyclobacteriaceae bacterium]
MYTAIKHISLFFLIIISHVQIIAQDMNDDLIWFEHYFQVEQIDNVDEVIKNTEVKIMDAQEEFNLLGEAKALKELGLLHLTQTYNYEKAMNYFLQALAFEENSNIQEGKIFTYLAIAKVFEIVEINYKSADFLNKAIELNKTLGDIHTKVYLLNKLGRVNTSMNELQLATQNFEEVLTYKGKIDLKYEAEAYFMLGQIEKIKGNFSQSLDTHKKALLIQRTLGDRYNEALTLYSIGSLYWSIKNEERARANYTAAIEVQQEIKDNAGLAETYLSIGALYYDQKHYERSIANLKLALKLALSANLHVIIRDSYLKLSQCYKQLNKFEQALDYQEEFLAMNDFIENDKDKQQLVKIQNVHNIQDFETKIDKLDEERAKKEKQLAEQEAFKKNLLILTSFILIIAILLLILYFVKRQSNKKLTIVNEKVARQNLELQDLNATKDKFFSIISHDLKGPLNSLSSFTYLLTDHIDSMSKEEIQTLAADLDKSQKNLYALLENLLEWSRSQTGNIEFKPEVFDLTSILKENRDLLLAQAQSKNIEIIYDTTESELQVNANKNSVNTVIRNLISNAIKFTPTEGKITLGLQKNNNEVNVSIADNGVGMSDEVVQKIFRIDTKHSTKGTANEKGTGLGLILCKEFIEKNGGRIWVSSEVGKGSIFSFSLPVN